MIFTKKLWCLVVGEVKKKENLISHKFVRVEFTLYSGNKADVSNVYTTGSKISKM